MASAVVGVWLVAFACQAASQPTPVPTQTPGQTPAQTGVEASVDVGVDVGVIETLRLGALDLKARHIRPEGAGLATVVLVHDTLGAFDDPLIVGLQAGLAERGLASLAINLSLNVNGRLTALDCNARHTHRHEDALREIDAWTDWLLGEGLGPVLLAGHRRGGAQIAWLLAKGEVKAEAALLLAPSGWTPRQADAEYRARYAAGLAALLTRIAGKKADEIVENVPFLHCGAVDATKASIESYYGAQPMRDTPTALAECKVQTLAFAPGEGASPPENDVAARLAELANPMVIVREIPGADAQFSGDALAPTVDAMAAYFRSVIGPAGN